MANDRDLTGLLRAWSGGDQDALASFAVIVQQELRDLARRLLAGEQRNDAWRPTELVQEAYLRLLDWRSVEWHSRAHFFATVAQMMRRVLVDAARTRQALKRGEGLRAVSLAGIDVAAQPRVDLVAVEAALERLATVYPRAAQVVELRFFGGFSVEETAAALAISRRTAINDWNAARAWLRAELSNSN